MNKRKLLERARNNPRDVRFSDFVVLVEAFGYGLDRIQGSHRIYVHPTVPKRLTLQPRRDGKAKTYQVEQFLDVIDDFGLSLEDQP